MIHPSAGPTEPVANLLGRVIEHHRDRDEATIFWRHAYVVGEGTPHQEVFDQAIELWAAEIEQLDGAVQDELEAMHGKWNSLSGLPPKALIRLAEQPRSVQLAHAVAAAYCAERHCDLSVSLEKGIPKGSRVVAQYPELQNQFTDRDFLLPIGGSVEPGYGWVTYKGHDIHVHPGLRRAFTNRVNFGLLALLWQQHRAGLQVGVAVDHMRLCPTGELPRIVELDRWFGAPFSTEDLDDPRVVGGTLHSRPFAVSPAEPAGLHTEFWWSCDDNLKTFTAEELPQPREDQTSPVLCRFVHSIRDISTKRFIHLDGAITVYDAATYKQRYQQAVDRHRDRVWSTKKPKLFRLDVPDDREELAIEDEAWVDIITSFFRGNELVLEYFSGKSFNELYKDQYGIDHPYIAAEREQVL